MIRLTQTTEKLQAVLAGAVVATQPQAIVCYSDQTATGYAGGKQVTVLNSTTDVDILSAPSASTTRDVDFLSIHNRDSASITVTVKYDISATDSTIIKATLLTLETIEYTHGSGWKVIDANGNIKTSASGSPTGVAGGDLTGTYPNPTIANGAIALDELSDVVITTPATGATLIYDGANWIDGALDLADNDARTGILPVANGGTGVTTVVAIAALFTLPVVTVYITGSGTHTITANAKYLVIELQGGGGGGAASGLGAGNGGDGGDTTFGGSLTAAKGTKGQTGTGGTGGIGTGGDINLVGQNGGNPSGAGGNPGAFGGGTFFGAGGQGFQGLGGGAGSSAAANSGGGGGGAGSGATANTGGGGGGGGYVRKLITSPSASYAYAVGAGGAAGTGGTANGGAGAAGVIIVTEYFI